MKITIKYGKGYEETWAVYEGTASEVRAEIIDYFGFSLEAVADMTLNTLVGVATQVAHGHTVALNLFGHATPAPAPAASPPPSPAPAAPATSDAWAQAEAAMAQPQASAATPPARDPLFAEIDGIGDVKTLKLLFATNRLAIEANSELRAHWSARGKALMAAA